MRGKKAEVKTVSSNKEQDQRLEAVKLAIQQIQKTHGAGAIMRFGDTSAEDRQVKVISTGSLSLDHAIGVGGMPRGRVAEVFGPEASGKCVAQDSIVFSEKGMLPIQNFGDPNIPEFQSKKISLYSENSTHRTSHFYNGGKKRTIKVKTRSGYEIEGTPNHRIRILDKNGSFIFNRLDKLQKGDYTAIQRDQEFFGNKVNYSEFEKTFPNKKPKKDFTNFILTTELGKLLGYLVGDGTLTNTGFNKNNIQLTVADEEVARDVNTLCKKIFKETPRITPDKRTKTTRRMVIHNVKARTFLAYLGLSYANAAGKHIPKAVLQAPKAVVAGFFSGLFEADASFSGSTIELVSKSERLIRESQIVLLNFGIISKKHQRYNKDYRTNYYYLSITGQEDKKLFAQEIGFASRRKQNKLIRHLKNTGRSATNVDSIPHLNGKLAKLFLKLKQQVRKRNRDDWDVVYDYLPKMARKPSFLTYPRLERILRSFGDCAHLPEYKQIKKLFEHKFFWDPIVKLEPGFAHVFDFTVPKNATFFANGFLNHNTTLCLHIIAEAQKNGGTAAFIDAEHALDPARAQSIGVNLDDMLISQPDTGEQALEIAETLIRSGGVDVIIVDSVAALVPKAEIEGEMGDAMMGVQARLMSQAMRKLAGAINRSQTALIFTNQIRMKIGVMFGNPETTPGGRALKFFASVRLDTRKIGNITDPDNKVIGSRHRVRVVKNKVAPPFRDAEFDIMNLGGISKSGDLIDLAEKLAVVEKSGSFYKFDGQVIAQGREAAKTELESNHKLFAAMEKQVKDKMAHEHHLEISPTPKPSTEE